MYSLRIQPPLRGREGGGGGVRRLYSQARKCNARSLPLFPIGLFISFSWKGRYAFTHHDQSVALRQSFARDE